VKLERLLTVLIMCITVVFVDLNMCLGQSYWKKSYGTDYLSGIQSTNDGNFLMVGYRSYEGFVMKIKPNGDTIWTKIFGGTKENFIQFNTIKSTKDSNFLLLGYASSDISYGFVVSIIADQYAYKNTLFTYKIPTYGIDTLNFGYVPLKVPSGMTVSAGGTVTWTPKTDSVYMDHAEFLVFNDMGRKDTLTFNIFVNSNHQKPVSAKPLQISKSTSVPFEITVNSFPGYVKFSLPPTTGSLCIYDIRGRIVDKITPAASSCGTSFFWPDDQSGSSKIHAGKYFVKATAGKNSMVKSFVLVR
jgi:hypothetical protein